MESTAVYTLIVEEPQGSIEYYLVQSDEPDDRPIECVGGRDIITGHEVDPLPFHILVQKLLYRADLLGH